jgi:hypothetical protein
VSILRTLKARQVKFGIVWKMFLAALAVTVTVGVYVIAYPLPR